MVLLREERGHWLPGARSPMMLVSSGGILAFAIKADEGTNRDWKVRLVFQGYRGKTNNSLLPHKATAKQQSARIMIEIATVF